MMMMRWGMLLGVCALAAVAIVAASDPTHLGTPAQNANMQSEKETTSPEAYTFNVEWSECVKTLERYRTESVGRSRYVVDTDMLKTLKTETGISFMCSRSDQKMVKYVPGGN